MSSAGQRSVASVASESAVVGTDLSQSELHRHTEVQVGRTRLRRYGLRLLPLLALLITWQLLSTWLGNVRVYPTPELVWHELVVLVRDGETPLGSSYMHASATLYRLSVAFSLAFFIGTTLGILAGRRKAFFDLSDNLVWIAMTVPSIVWVFIFLVVLGIREVVPIAALTVVLTPPTMITVAEGTKAISQETLVLADSYKVALWDRITGIFVPSVVPYLASSARVTFALGIKVVIIAEVIGLPTGIGILIKFGFDTLFLAPVVAWGIILIVVGLVGDTFVFGPLERRANRWVTGGASET